jgi:hypothetical protein
MNNYPGDMPLLDRTLGDINSQVAEQCNSSLEVVCSQMAYMSQQNFVKYAKYFLRCYNAKKISTMPIGVQQ